MDVLINLRDDGVKIINVGLIDSTSQELRFCAGSNSAADRMLIGLPLHCSRYGERQR